MSPQVVDWRTVRLTRSVDGTTIGPIETLLLGGGWGGADLNPTSTRSGQNRMRLHLEPDNRTDVSYCLTAHCKDMI